MINDKDYWNLVWSKFRKDDRTDILKNMADRVNTKDYWDTLWSSTKRRYEKYSMQRAWWLIKEKDAKSVLDVGCGNGRLLFGVKEGRDVFGIDISEVAIERMKREYGVGGVAMDIYEMGNLDRTFDFVVCNHTLEHLYRDEEVVRLCYDRLNPNGTFYVAVPNNMSGPEETEEHVRKYDRDSLQLLMVKIFGNCRIEIIGNHLIGISEKR